MADGSNNAHQPPWAPEPESGGSGSMHSRPRLRARHLEGDEDGLEQTALGKSANAIALLVDQALTMTMIEAPKV